MQFILLGVMASSSISYFEISNGKGGDCVPTKTDWKAAFAICAAIIGAGFASGQEIVSFFSGLGRASWLGVTAASVGMGLLIYVIMRLSNRIQARTFPALYGTLMGQACQDAVSVLHALLCLCAASAMLSAGAELGALTFSIAHSYAWGLLLTLSIALLAVFSGLHSLSVLGMILVPLMGIYYIAIALGNHTSSTFSIDGLLLTIPMGLLYACFNAALVGSTICLTAQENASPARTAALSGILLGLLLSCANRALLGAGEDVLRMSLPTVVLTARWGVLGYYTTILVMWMAVLTTLCALLHSLCEQLQRLRIPRPFALLIASLSACGLSICGFEALVNIAYPLLGWVCSFALIALMLFLPESDASKE